MDKDETEAPNKDGSEASSAKASETTSEVAPKTSSKDETAAPEQPVHLHRIALGVKGQTTAHGEIRFRLAPVHIRGFLPVSGIVFFEGLTTLAAAAKTQYILIAER